MHSALSQPCEFLKQPTIGFSPSKSRRGSQGLSARGENTALDVLLVETSFCLLISYSMAKQKEKKGVGGQDGCYLSIIGESCLCVSFEQQC